ncbi:hypothetical protein F2981_28635 (plasmid) [Sinorhizobium meliloti]|nr:hypothetical protein [Sinorhizobium meliloti]
MAGGVRGAHRGGLFFFLFRTRYGLAIRATAENRQNAALMGSTSGVSAANVYGLYAGITAISGVLMGASIRSIRRSACAIRCSPSSSPVLAGLGSLGGALVAALLLGVIEAFGRDFGGSSYSHLAILQRSSLSCWFPRAASSGADCEMAQTMKNRWAGLLLLVVILVVLALLPVLVNNYWLRIATGALMWAGLACFLEHASGYAGYSISPFGFFGIGAYATAILMGGFPCAVPPHHSHRHDRQALFAFVSAHRHCGCAALISPSPPGPSPKCYQFATVVRFHRRNRRYRPASLPQRAASSISLCSQRPS